MEFLKRSISDYLNKKSIIIKEPFLTDDLLQRDLFSNLYEQTAFPVKACAKKNIRKQKFLSDLFCETFLYMHRPISNKFSSKIINYQASSPLLLMKKAKLELCKIIKLKLSSIKKFNKIISNIKKKNQDDNIGFYESYIIEEKNCIDGCHKIILFINKEILKEINIEKKENSK